MWYVGVDVHEAATVVSFRNANGVVERREVVKTTAVELRRLFASTRCRMRIAVEAGPLAEWMVQILTSKRRHVVVCDGRRNRVIAHGTKTDRVDADKLSELLRLDALRPVYVGEHRNQQLRRLVQHYLKLSRDRGRAVQRLRSLLARSGVKFSCRSYSRRTVPLRQIRDHATKFIAKALVQQIEMLTPLISAARAEMIAEATRDAAYLLLQTFPYVGPIRAAELLSIIGTPHRFASVRKFWAYGGLAVEHRVSSEHRVEKGLPVHARKRGGLRRLNRNCNPRLKKILKDVALGVSLKPGPLRQVYDAHVAKGKRPAIARVVLARRIAAIILAMWRSNLPFESCRVTAETVRSGRASTDPFILGPDVSPKVLH